MIIITPYCGYIPSPPPSSTIFYNSIKLSTSHSNSSLPSPKNKHTLAISTSFNGYLTCRNAASSPAQNPTLGAYCERYLCTAMTDVASCCPSASGRSWVRRVVRSWYCDGERGTSWRERAQRKFGRWRARPAEYFSREVTLVRRWVRHGVAGGDYVGG